MRGEKSLIPKGYAQGRYSKLTIPNSLKILQEQWDASLIEHSNSLSEANILTEYLEGNHYSEDTLRELQRAKRPAEKHNLLLMITRRLEGYFNRVVTTAVANAIDPDHEATALVHNEAFAYSQRISRWESTRKLIVKDIITAGLGCAGIEVLPTGRYDTLGREINKVKFSYIPFSQVLVDFRAKEPDLSDARYIHQWQYLSEDEVKHRFGEKALTEIQNMHNTYGDGVDGIDTAIYEHSIYSKYSNFEFWKDGNSYFIVTSYEKSINGSITVTYWHGDYQIERQALPIKMFPIIAIPLLRKRASRRWYSPLYEQIPTQDSINQSLLHFQKLIGTERLIADKRAVSNKDLPELTKKMRVIGETLHVNNIDGIRIEHLTGEAQAHINKLYTSIKFMLDEIGINEAFLGVSKAGDSGRKFEGQRSASEATLDYIFTPINLLYETLLRGSIHFNSIYRQATEQIRVIDDLNQARWKTINQPFLMPTGEWDSNGQPILKPIKREVQNPTTGAWEISYVNEFATSLYDIDVEIEIHTAPYDDTDAKETAFIESILNGIGGQLLASAHPASIMYLYGLLTKNLRTRHSERISKLFQLMAQQLGGLNLEDPRLYMQGSSMTGGLGNGVSQGASSMGTQGDSLNNAGKSVLGKAGMANDLIGDM